MNNPINKEDIINEKGKTKYLLLYKREYPNMRKKGKRNKKIKIG